MTSTTSTGSDDVADRAAPPDRGPAAGVWRKLRNVLLRPDLALPLVALALMLYLSFANQYYLSERNLLNVMEAIALLGIAAAFATIVVISGGIDLTPTVIFVNTGIVCYWTLKNGLPITLTILIGVLVGGVIGLVNGLLVALLNLNPFIVTLGTNFLFTGVAFVVTDGDAVPIENEAFVDIANSDLVGNIPTVTVIMLVAFALAFFVLRFTRFGVHVFAIGGDENAARLSGVPVTRVKTLVYVVAGLASGVGGVLLVSASGSAAPFLAAGQNDLLIILAAVIIGGTALEGGRGGVIGTLVGIWLLATISNGLVLQNVSSFWQPVVIGVILLIAIVLDELRRRAALRAARV